MLGRRLLFAVVGLSVWADPVGAAPLVMRSDRLIARLESLGVAIDRLDRRARAGARCYNIGVHRLFSRRLRDELVAVGRVDSEVIHVVQDCLDCLETPSHHLTIS